HKKIGMLSKGYRQRVGLCQALIHDPELLILDEPTSGLDPNQVLDIRGLIEEIGRDKTVIFSSHILSEVEAVASRILIINRGKLIADAPKAQIRDIAGNSSRVLVELEGPVLDPAPLASLAGVREVKDLGDNRWEIIAEVDIDIRRALFQEVVKQGQVMLRLEKETYTLEEAFRLLTAPSAQA
ncbi:MAG: ATP-binding cassette domain-containing protein, partial [Bacteroidetes bacterium]